MSTLCKTRRSGLFVPWGRFLLIFGHPQNCKREGGFDPSVFTLSSMFPFLKGKSKNYPALWFLYLLHFSTGPRDHSQNVLERSFVRSFVRSWAVFFGGLVKIIRAGHVKICWKLLLSTNRSIWGQKNLPRMGELRDWPGQSVRFWGK